MKKQRLWLGFLLILGLWLIGHYFLDSRLIPSPLSTLIHLVGLLVQGELLIHGIFSIYRLFAAVFLALILGTATGIVMGMNRQVERVLAPFTYIMFPVPKAALLPILFVLFGLGDMTKIVLIVLILYFQMALSVYDGVRDIPADIFLSARTLRLRGWALYRHVVIPAILPNIFTALRISVGIGIAVLFFAETYATRYGLGYYIMNQWSLLNYEAMYSGILLLGAMGYGLFRGIDLLRQKWVHWR